MSSRIPAEPDSSFAPPKPCTKCDRGWVFVGPEYLDEQWPLPAPLPLDATSAEVALHVVKTDAAVNNRLHYADAVIPCQRCMPTQYDRWRAGDYAPRIGESWSLRK